MSKEKVKQYNQEVKVREILARDEEEWRHIGEEAYVDKPEFQEGNVLWPDIHHIINEDRSLYLLAEWKEKIVGRLALRNSPSVSIIFDLCVAPAYRRMGIGKRLVDYAIHKARSLDKEDISVMGEIDEEDPELLAFFRSCGFSESKGYSVIIDLQRSFSSSILEKEEMLHKEGFVLRKLQATDRDIDLAASLQKKYFPNFHSYIPVLEMIHRMMEKNFIILVMEKNSRPAGIVIGASDCATRNYRHIIKKGGGLLTSIAVCENFRRKGIASVLILGLMREVKLKGDDSLLYGGCGMDTPSMRLARKCGGEKLRKHYCFKLNKVKE